MYATFFGLRELPFNNTPDPRFFYSTPDHEEALASLVYTVQERKGFVLLTGEVGAGKTLVSRMMLRKLGSQVAFASIHHAVQNATDLMQSICTDLELSVEQDASNAQLVRALHDFLLSQFAQDNPVVLVLDEAQALPTDAFEQLRMIGNLEADDAKLLQTIIVGQPELQDRFASPELRQLRQRVFRSFHLPALTRPATEGYIRHRLEVAGGTEIDIFDSVAIDKIFEYSRGLPRVINTLCDNAMLSGYSADRRDLDRALVESVIEQMMPEDERRQARVDEPSAATAEATRQPGPVGSQTPMPGGTGGWYSAPAHSPGMIDTLAHRLVDLELRLSERSQQPDTGPWRGEIAGSDPAFSRGFRETAEVEHRLHDKAEEAARCLSELESHLRQTPALVAESRAVHVELDPLVQRAKDMITRMELACRQLGQREGRVQKLVSKADSAVEHVQLAYDSERAKAGALVERIEAACARLSHREKHLQQVGTKVSTIVEEVRRIFDGLKRTAAKTSRAERRAKEVHDRLLAQSERSRQLVVRMARAASSPAFQAPEDGPVELLTEASALAADVTTGRARFEQLLSTSRDSLTDLRTLVHGISDHSVSQSTPTRDAHPHPARPGDEEPTARLAHQVEGLLAMVESGANSSTPASAG